MLVKVFRRHWHATFSIKKQWWPSWQLHAWTSRTGVRHMVTYFSYIAPLGLSVCKFSFQFQSRFYLVVFNSTTTNNNNNNNKNKNNNNNNNNNREQQHTGVDATVPVEKECVSLWAPPRLLIALKLVQVVFWSTSLRRNPESSTSFFSDLIDQLSIQFFRAPGSTSTCSV